MRARRVNVRAVRWFFALCVLPMLCLFPYIGAVNNPNENVRSYMTIAIVEHDTFKIDDVIATFGWVNDMAAVPQKAAPPQHYSVKGPAVSLAAVPVYWLVARIAKWTGHPYPTATSTKEQRDSWIRMTTWTGRLAVVQLPCFLFLLWFERWLRAVSRDDALRLSAVAAAGLGTNYLAYTNIFASHALCAVATFVCFGIVERQHRTRLDPRARSIGQALLAGWFAGWSVLLEYHALPVAVVLSLYAAVIFRRPLGLLAFGAGGGFHAAWMMLVQWRSFGSPFTPGHKMVESAGFAAQHQQGLFGVVWPSKEALIGLSFDVSYGFFTMSPFMWLGVLALPFGILFTFGRAHVRNVRRWALFVTLVAMLLLWGVSAGFLHWRGGWTVGPRYLTAAPPFFAYGALCALERVARYGRPSRAGMRGLAGGLAISGVIAIGTVGVVYDTLPESLPRPFAQFAWPMIRGGWLPHHVFELVGWTSTTPAYAACAALGLATLIGALFVGWRDLRLLDVGIRVLCLGIALWAGLRPSFGSPEDGSTMFAFHPEVSGFPSIWEPPARDRVTLLRHEAERYGPRRPCNWYRLADLERALGLASDAAKDETRAHGAARAQCSKLLF